VPALQIRRQARRFDADAVDFVLERVPQLTELHMDSALLQQRPIAAGRVVVERGHRLLLAAAATEGDAVLQRLKPQAAAAHLVLGVPTCSRARPSNSTN
jgi:type III secretion protein K